MGLISIPEVGFASPRGRLRSNDSSRSALRPDPGDEPTVHKWLPVPLFPSVHHRLVLRVMLPGPDLLDLIPLADDQVHAALGDASSHLGPSKTGLAPREAEHVVEISLKGFGVRLIVQDEAKVREDRHASEAKW